MEELPSIIPVKHVPSRLRAVALLCASTEAGNANRGPYFVIPTPLSVIPTQVGTQVP